MSPLTILTLYIAFRLKQLTCDFFLQTGWMASKKGNPGMEGYKALLSHCLIHAAGTLVVFLIFAPALWWFCIVDFLVHATVDRVKAVITRKSAWKTHDNAFWWAFGLDQEAHNFTHLSYLIFIVAHFGGVM